MIVMGFLSTGFARTDETGGSMRTVDQIENLLRIAHEGVEHSRARDYWEGIEDTLRWVLGELPEPIEAWEIVNAKTGATQNDGGA